MGLFGKDSAIKWVDLQSEEQLNALLQQPDDQAVVLLKHSTRCNISAMVKSRLEKNWEPGSDTTPVYLDLLRFRGLSDKIAEISGIRHESPQIIIFRNGTAVYNASHGSIDAEAIEQKIHESKP